MAAHAGLKYEITDAENCLISWRFKWCAFEATRGPCKKTYLNFTAHQDYFTHFEPSRSLGGAKTRDPWAKSTWPPENRTWLVLHVTRARLEHGAVTHMRKAKFYNMVVRWFSSGSNFSHKAQKKWKNHYERYNQNNIFVCLTARQDHFIDFEPSQSLGWVKTGDPQEKTPDRMQECGWGPGLGYS